MKYIILVIKTIFYCFSAVFIMMSTYVGYELGVVMSPKESYGTTENYYYLFFSIVFFLASCMLVLFIHKIINAIYKIFTKEKG